MSSASSHWAVLGIEPTTDGAVIRRAYAAKLKVSRPEDDRAAFERLRAAYEFAMRLTRGGAQPRVVEQPAAPVIDRRPPPPVPPSAHEALPVEQPGTNDAALEELQRAFTELQQRLNADQAESPRADAALSRILESAALQNLAVEQRVQQRLSVMLASSIPKSDPLLLRASNRFRWSQPEAQLQLTPAMAAILTRLFDLDFLHSLRSGHSRYAAGFRKLQRRKIPVLSWMTAHFNKAGVLNDYQVLQFLRVNHPGLLPLLEPSTVAWWDRQVSRPHVSFPIILVGLVISFLGSIGAFATEGIEFALLGAARIMAVFVCLALWKLLLLDWARHLIRKRWPMPSLILRLAWLPASVVIVLVSSIIPASTIAAWILAVPALCLVQWAWTVGGMEVPQGTSDLLRIPLIRVLLHNFLIAIWWFMALQDLPAATHLQAPVICALAASSIGSPAARAAWEQQLTSAQRTACIGAMAFIAVAAVACLWWVTPIESWRLVAAALVIVAVVAHRHAAIMLGRRQQEIRFGWMIVCFCVFAAVTVQSAPWLQSRGLILTGFGLLFASTVLLCTGMMLWNERRGRVAAYRDDPVHESLQW